jgi:glutamate-ammonia-ligase adenylyltransferase
LKKSDVKIDLNKENRKTLELLSKITPHFTQAIAANPNLIKDLPAAENELVEKDYAEILLSAVADEKDFKNELAILRKNWSRFLLEIVVFDAYEKITRRKSKQLQTGLAEASIEAALFIARRELERRFSTALDEFPFAVLGLGKLGGGGMDYGSDLDLILIYDDEKAIAANNLTHRRVLQPRCRSFRQRAVEPDARRISLSRRFAPSPRR